MPKLRLALIVRANRELRLSAGEVPKEAAEISEFEVVTQTVETPEGPAFPRVGLARVGSVFLSGAEVLNPAYPDDSLTLSWYLPDEEDASKARPILLKTVGLIPAPYPRDPAERGCVWRFKVEGTSPFVETLFFDTGFQPPFKPSELTLHLTDISRYGFASTILTQVLHCHRAPSYSEGDWAFPDLIAEGSLDE
jgi:hypothetical protein